MSRISTLSLEFWTLKRLKTIIYLPSKRPKMKLHVAPSRFALQNKPSFCPDSMCFISLSWHIFPIFKSQFDISTMRESHRNQESPRFTIGSPWLSFMGSFSLFSPHLAVSIPIKWWHFAGRRSNPCRIWAMTLPWRLRRPWWGASETCPGALNILG